MANVHTTTAPKGAEPFDDLTTPDRPEFRNTLDLLFKALRADWEYFAVPSDASNRMQLGNAAASAWATCVQSLHTIQDMREAHPDLKAAAARMLATIPEQTPKATSVNLHAANILSMAKKHKKADPGLTDLLEEAFCLLKAYSANLIVMSLR
ncbi:MULTISPECIES: hypothetical protein [unclassified Sulfitobacter]|uniref:hypothetical protein n=1 Tax=unclassified Sulfitobacter TaxID=196795 RepID=UPI0023E0E0C7|nr:hypothetical protein [Sulfitobacter sp. Ks41]MDF3362466.1 hypothetical protein [Sulfitobacter sp. Ks41]|tara:strand:- start:1407 stop:1862 length:456 start_codon:yes stop_codon:yes gene_type:complete